MRELYELRLRCHDHEDLRGFHVMAVGVGLVCICWICILAYDESESKPDLFGY